MHRKYIRATDAASGNDIDIPTAVFADGQFVIYTGGALYTQFVVQSHNVSTDNAVARWDGVTGHLIQDSTVIIDDAGNITGVTTINTIPVGDFVRGPTPATATDNALARWDATTGRLIQNSIIIVGDTGNASGFLNISTTTINSRDPNKWVDGPTPALATDNHIALWDTGSGRLIKDSPVNIDPTTGDITTPGDIAPAKITGIPVGLLVKSGSPTPHPDNSIAKWSNGAGNPIVDSVLFVDGSGNVTGFLTLNAWPVAEYVGLSGVTPTVNGQVAVFADTLNSPWVINAVPVVIDASGNIYNAATIASASVGAVTKNVDDLVTCTNATVTNQAIPRYFGTAGRRITPSPLTVDASGAMTGLASITVPSSGLVKTTAQLAYTTTTSAASGYLAQFTATDSRIADSGIPVNSVIQPTGTSTDNAVARWDGTTGLINLRVQNSLVIIDDSGNVTGMGTLNTRTIARWVDGPAAGGSTDNTLAVWDGTSGRLLKDGGATSIAVNPGTGEITTPVGVLLHSTTATYVDNSIIRRDGTGYNLQDSSVLLSDPGAMSGLLSIQGTTGTAKAVANLPAVSSATANNLASYSNATAGSYGIGDSGVIATAVVTAVSAFGTDNRVLRSDGTAKASQASPVTLDDTGNFTGAGTFNAVTVEGHKTRHLPGGADSMFTGTWNPGMTPVWESSPAGFKQRLIRAALGAASTVGGSYFTVLPNSLVALSSGTRFVAILKIPYTVAAAGNDLDILVQWTGATLRGIVTAGNSGGHVTSSGGAVILGTTTPNGAPIAGSIEVYWAGTATATNPSVACGIRMSGSGGSVYTGMFMSMNHEDDDV